MHDGAQIVHRQQHKGQLGMWPVGSSLMTVSEWMRALPSLRYMIDMKWIIEIKTFVDHHCSVFWSGRSYISDLTQDWFDERCIMIWFWSGIHDLAQYTVMMGSCSYETKIWSDDIFACDRRSWRILRRSDWTWFRSSESLFIITEHTTDQTILNRNLNISQ